MINLSKRLILRPSHKITNSTYKTFTRKLPPKNKLPGLLRFQLNFINNIPGTYNIFLPSETTGDLLQLHENPASVFKKLKVAQLIHTVIRLIQIGCLAHSFNYQTTDINKR